jgi:hypothetical protein
VEEMGGARGGQATEYKRFIGKKIGRVGRIDGERSTTERLTRGMEGIPFSAPSSEPENKKEVMAHSLLAENSNQTRRKQWPICRLVL